MSLETSGVGNVRKALTHVVRETSGKATRRSVRAAGKVFQAAIQQAAPELDADTVNSTALAPGALKNDVRVRVKENEQGTFTSLTGPGEETRHVAGWVEYGHRQVHGGKSQMLVNGKTKGDGVVIGRVPAHPYIRPSYESSLEEANAAFAAKQKRQLEELR